MKGRDDTESGIVLIDPAAAPPAPGSAVAGSPPADLKVFVTVFCALLQQAVRVGWIARETVEGTRAVARLAGDLHRRAGGFSLAVGKDHFRHCESGARLEASGRALLQLLRLFHRRGLSEVRFAAGVAPLGIKNLARVLLEPDCDLAAVLPRDCGIEIVSSRADAPTVVILHQDGTEEPADALRVPLAVRDRVTDPLARFNVPVPPSNARAGLGADPEVAVSLSPLPRAPALECKVQQVCKENNIIREAVARIATVGEHPFRPVILTVIDAMEQHEHLLLMLASLRQHDLYTFNHSCNVALLATTIARYLGVAGANLQQFAAAALLHDIGKLYTPLAVLNKSGKFTPDEWKTMRRHPVEGMEILTGAGFENTYSERVTLMHHVSFDGSGYPALTGAAADLHSQIVQVADIYDAFTTIRPYRQQARPREVLQVMQEEAGKQFNPAVVQAVVRLMGETPIGAVVKLDNGQLGLVADMGSTLDNRPLVRLIQDEFGNRPQTPTLLDLSARRPKTGEYAIDIVELVDPVIRNIPIGRYI